MVSIGIRYVAARLACRLGIAMPGQVFPLEDAVMAMTLVPDQAAPVDLVAGVTGPLTGADLLHFEDIPKLGTGMASIDDTFRRHCPVRRGHRLSELASDLTG